MDRRGARALLVLAVAVVPLLVLLAPRAQPGSDATAADNPGGPSSSMAGPTAIRGDRADRHPRLQHLGRHFGRPHAVAERGGGRRERAGRRAPARSRRRSRAALRTRPWPRPSVRRQARPRCRRPTRRCRRPRSRRRPRRPPQPPNPRPPRPRSRRPTRRRARSSRRTTSGIAGSTTCRCARTPRR